MVEIVIVVFVEGETEKEFYNALFQYYKTHSTGKINKYKIINVKGIGRFENKMSLKLQHEVLIKYAAKNVKVVCCYDTDVFEFAQRPPVNWGKVTDNVKNLGVESFTRVAAKYMIEDWFLADLSGVCKFLKIKEVKRAKGKTGNEKLSKLFKRGNKLYIKGTATSKFIPSLDINKIREYAKSELLSLEKLLNVKMKY